MRLVLPLNRWLVLSHLLVFTLPAGAVLLSGALAKDLARQTQEDLEHQAALLALHVASELHLTGPTATLADLAAPLHTLLADAREATLAGLRVVDTSGTVVASSSGEVGDDLSGDPLVVHALAGQGVTDRRPRGSTRASSNSLSSPSRHADYRVFVARPLLVDGQTVGAVVLSRTPREELQTLWQMAPSLALALALGLLTTVLLGALSGHVLSRSLRALAGASQRIAAGSTVAVADLERPADSHVAETRELSEAMATMSERLQERVAYIAEFAGNVSHEFKTPVSALRGTIELLRDDEQMSASQRTRFLDNALEDLDRLSRLVGGLLRLARAEESTDRTRLELAPVLDRVCQEFPGTELVGPFGTVFGNAEQLEAAVRNLVDNARRHGGDGVHVRIRGSSRLGRVGVEVEDDGPGISSANLPRIFDRFFTTGRALGGTGLGLALVKAIARSHGGDIEVDSRPGRTVFSLSLPAA